MGSVDFDDGYSDDPIEINAPIQKKSKVLHALALLLIMSFTLKGVFAANVSLGGSGKTEFGQGIIATAACSGNTAITITPQITFTNSSGAGAYKLSGFNVAGVPSSCIGKVLKFNFYSETGTSPLAIVDSSTSYVDIRVTSGSFSNAQGGVSLGSLTSTGFTATFTTPQIQATDISRITVQSGYPESYPNIGSIDVPLADTLSFPSLTASGTGPYTLETWIKFTAAPTGNALIFVGSYGQGLWINSSLNTVYLALWGPGTGMQTFNISALSTNTWYHMVVVRDSSKATQLFINGSRNGNAAVTDTNNYSNGINAMLVSGAGGDVAAKLSNVRIANEALYDPTASSIAVPVAPLTVSTSTLLLLKGDTNRYLYDTAVPSRTITVSGGVTSSSDNPLG